MSNFIAIAAADELHANEMKAFEHEGRRYCS
jgi:hypothetical protein